MNSKWSTKGLVVCGVLLSGLWSGQVQAASGSFQQTIQLDEAVLLDVSTGSGNIEIRPGDTREIEIIGRIKAGTGLFQRTQEEAEELVRQFEANPPVHVSNGEVRVGHIKDRAFNNNVSISYEIVVPADTKVKSHTGSGSQTISGLAGPVEAGTGSGELKLTDIGGSVAARSGSGAIRADGIAGAFEAHTGSGSVQLTQTAPGDVVVTTGSGSSELHGVDGALQVRAGSGRIVVDGKQDGVWNLDTGSGSVRIKLPEDAAFELDAESGSGSIVVDHPITVQGKISKRHLKGVVRGGGDILRIETGSGSIKVN
jgi:DUF4097 and DUF4098 domain-containing protein YvlB